MHDRGMAAGTRRVYRDLVAYFAVVYLISWTVWGTQIAAATGRLSWALPEVLAFLGVSLPAVALTALTSGRTGLREYASRFARWRVGWQWYAAALLIMPALSLAAIGLHRLLGGTHEIGVLAPVQMVPQVLLSQVVVHLLTEEAGWRGYALPRLQFRSTALVASLILGVVWALWHLPLFFVPGSYQTYPFIGFLIQVVAGSVLITWIFNNTQGSILLAALFHGAMNTSLAVLNTLWGDPRVFWLFVALITLAAVAVVLVEGPRNLSRHTVRFALPRQVSVPQKPVDAMGARVKSEV